MKKQGGEQGEKLWHSYHSATSEAGALAVLLQLDQLGKCNSVVSALEILFVCARA